MTLLTTAQVAQELKVHPSTVSKWRRYADFPAPAFEHRSKAQERAGKGGQVLWELEKITAWLEAQPKPEPAIRTGLSGVTHGTRTAYIKGCQCRACTRANREYGQRYKASVRRKPKG